MQFKSSFSKAILLVSIALFLLCSSPVRTYAQAGSLSPSAEAWLRQIYFGKTTTWDLAYINSTHWTNFYKTYSNTLYSLLAQGVTNIVPSYGTNFNASVTGHTGYITFNTNFADLGTTLWTSNTVTWVSNVLFNLPTNNWNNSTNVSIWASNTVLNVSNVLFNLPTNNWNFATNDAIFASNSVVNLSNLVVNLPTNAWNQATNESAFASNVVVNLPTNDWNNATNNANFASNQVVAIGLLTNGYSWATNVLIGLPTNGWNNSTNIANWASNIIVGLPTNNWNAAFTNTAFNESTSNNFTFTNSTLYVTFKTNYAGGGGSTCTDLFTGVGTTGFVTSTASQSNSVLSGTGWSDTISITNDMIDGGVLFGSVDAGESNLYFKVISSVPYATNSLITSNLTTSLTNALSTLMSNQFYALGSITSVPYATNSLITSNLTTALTNALSTLMSNQFYFLGSVVYQSTSSVYATQAGYATNAGTSLNASNLSWIANAEIVTNGMDISRRLKVNGTNILLSGEAALFTNLFAGPGTTGSVTSIASDTNSILGGDGVWHGTINITNDFIEGGLLFTSTNGGTNVYCGTLSDSNNWNKAFTNTAFNESTSNNFTFTNKTLYVTFKTNYSSSSSTDTSELTNIAVFASNGVVAVGLLTNGYGWATNVLMGFPTNDWSVATNIAKFGSNGVIALNSLTTGWNNVSAFGSNGVVALNSLTSGYNQVKSSTNSFFWLDGRYAGENSVWGQGLLITNIYFECEGASIWGSIFQDGGFYIDDSADGASQHGQVNNGYMYIAPGAAGALQLGYVDDAAAGAGHYGRMHIGADGQGAVQMGYISDGYATNNGRGSLQLLNLSSDQIANMTGHASLGLGAVTVSNDQAIVLGDGQVSHGKGSVSASGGFWDSGTRITSGGSSTNLNAPYFTLTKGGTNQTIAASALTLVTWNNAMVDHLGCWTPETNGVTIQATGNYMFNISCKGVGNQGIVGLLYKNGSGLILGDQSFGYDIGLAATYYPFSLTTPILACASGDVFQVYISYYSGNYVVQGSITNTWFSGWKVN